jgi:hypothetical protein
MAWDFYQLEQSLGIPEESPFTPDLEDYEYLLELDPAIEEPPKVKHISRFLNAVRTWLDENPIPNDVVLAHPGGWLF